MNFFQKMAGAELQPKTLMSFFQGLSFQVIITLLLGLPSISSYGQSCSKEDLSSSAFEHTISSGENAKTVESDLNNPQGPGHIAHGVKFSYQLESEEMGDLQVVVDPANSWIFEGTEPEIKTTIDQVSGVVYVEVYRADCYGTYGNGQVLKVSFQNYNASLSLSGGIIITVDDILP